MMRALAESQDRTGGQHFTEGYISTHFRTSAIPSLNVQQLTQRIGLDQTVHLQASPADTFTMDLLQYLSP